MSGVQPGQSLEAVTEPYLLVSGIPCYVDQQGRRWTDGLWHKDLVEHLVYLKNFTLASPLRREPPPAGAACLTDDARFAQVRFIDLPASNSVIAGLMNWPRVFRRLWGAVGEVRVVHAGVAEWPIPSGWAATVAARLRRRALLMNIESAFWRVEPNAAWTKRLRARIWEVANRWCVERATLPTFTQPDYAQQMLRDPGRGHVLHASWIDEEVIVGEQQATEVWASKEEAEPLALLYAGRLIRSKGLSDLLEAFAHLPQSIRLDVIGEGELKSDVKEAGIAANVRLLDPEPYGPTFFKLLQSYHAVLAPLRSDEQPRVVYDAYSQAVPVIGTRTPGLMACVREDETGWLVPVGDAAALREALLRAQRNRGELRSMGMAGLEVARSFTHREMHRRRRKLLSERLGV